MSTTKKRMRIRTLSVISIVMAVVVAVLIGVFIWLMDREFASIQAASTEYHACEEAAESIQDASLYLTEQAQLYAMTQNTKHMYLYFEEADVVKHREKAMEQLRASYRDQSTVDRLAEIVGLSNQLMVPEIHSMKLVSVATGVSEGNLPSAVREYSLTEEEAALSAEAKIALAIKLVSDDAYQQASNAIIYGVEDCTDEMLEKISADQNRYADVFNDVFLKLKIASFVLAALIVVFCASLWYLAIRPLGRFEKCVSKGELLPGEGAYELQLLAETYNRIYEENQENQRLLRHEADHDSLTRALNRRAFVRMMDVYGKGGRKFALIMIDVDHFKDINDTFGHSVGDQALVRVTSVLKKTFRSVDHVFRFGGDELAVIMTDADEKLRPIIEVKAEHIARELAEPSGDVPAITLSIGVAFYEELFSGEGVYSRADKALYHVKENGRNNVAFYEDL